MSKITVVDSICGAGKTSWAIQFMDNNFKDRYIYITPFLEEMTILRQIVRRKKK